MLTNIFNTIKTNKFSFLCVLILLLLGALAMCRGSLKHTHEIAEKSDIVVHDSLNREIILKHPLKKVVIANAYNTDLTELITAIGCLDTIVGVDQNILWNNEAFHNKFSKHNLICSRGGTDINYEKVISLNPEALIISSKGNWYDAQKKLGEFGIKVIVVDTHELKNFYANCDLLGKIFGQEKRAKQLKEYFGGQFEYVQNQLKKIKHPKTVYLECGRPGATAVKDSYFHSLVKYTGGINIMEDAVERHVVPEAVLLRNPDVIIKLSDRKWTYSYKPPTKERQLFLRNDILNRPGWNDITAVKNNDIFQLSYFSHCGASKIIGVLYVAKYLYPEYLPELHPEQVFKVWLEDYLQLPYIAGYVCPAT